MIEHDDAAGARTLYWYDKLGRVTHALSPLGTLTRNLYDANGNLTEKRIFATQQSLPANATGAAPAETGAYRTTQYQYDALGRLKKTITPNIVVASYATSLAVVTQNLETTYEYDALGRLVRTTDAKGAQTYDYYDKLGRKIAEIDAGLYRTDWTYDAGGNVASETRYATAQASAPSGITSSPPSAPAASADDRITTFIYDKMGRRLSETRLGVKINSTSTPGTYATANSTIAYQYNGLGEVTRKTEATGDYIGYSYDVGGRMTAEQRSAYTDVNGASVTPTVQYAYDGLNDLTRSVSLGAGGTIAAADRIATYAYGAGGRLLSTTDAEGFTRTYRYDAAGRKTREEYIRTNPDSTSAHEAIGTDYDAEGRVVRSGMLVDSNTDPLIDAWSRKGLGIDTAAMTYTAFGEISQRGFAHYDATTGAESTVFAEQFAYDDAGRLTKTNSGDGVWKFYAYDASGNQTLSMVSEGTDLTGLSLAQVMDLWGTNRANIGTNWVDGIVAAITQFDGRNQAIQVREPQREVSTTTKYDLVTQRGYNAFGEAAYEINANGARIDYTYNTMGRLVMRQSPAVEGVGENGLWITGYDASGAPTATSSTAVTFRPVEQFYFDVSGRLTASRDADGNLTRQSLLAGSGYNGSDALITATTTADGAVVRTYYDIQGDARRIEDQLYTASAPTIHFTAQTFDKLGRLTQLNHSGGLIDYYAYDGLGQLIKTWNNQLGNADPTYVERTVYDLQGRIVQSYAQGGDLTAYAYAWNGALATTGLGTFGGWTQTTTYANTKTLIEQSDIFDHLVGKTDLGGAVTGFTYDKAARLTQRSGGAALNYSYYNTGKISVATTLTGVIATGQAWDRTTQAYGYDKVGNLVSENLVNDGQSVVVIYNPYGSTTTITPYTHTNENATAAFDALDRMTSWSEAGSADVPASSIAYKYDANGNIRRSTSQYRALDAQGAASATVSNTDYWYRFDALNRVVTEKGAFQSGAIVRGSDGTDIFYDSLSERVIAKYGTARGEGYVYDAAGRVLQVWSGSTADGNGTNIDGTIAAGTLKKRSDFTYDLLGRVTLQNDYDTLGATVLYSRSIVYNTKNQVSTDSTATRRGSNVDVYNSTYSYSTSAAPQDYYLGAVVKVNAAHYHNGSYDQTYPTLYNYSWADGAVTASTVYEPKSADSSTWITSTYNYSVVGGQKILSSVSIGDGRPRTVTFHTDINGQVVRRDESDNNSATGDPHEVWYRFGGKELGYTGNNGTRDTDYATSIANRTATPGSGPFYNGSATSVAYADYDQSLTPTNSYSQGSSGGAYTVQSGDTLSSIASRLWGDSSLWYKLAEANGLSADTGLIEGQNLNIPVGVVVNAHNASTFQPYNPNETLGDVSPTVPKPGAPHKKHGCGGVGQILVAVVALVVAWYVAPYAIAAVANATAAAGAVTVTATAVSAGTAAVSTFATAAGYAAAGAVASVASQAVGIATGVQSKFSWNAVAMAGIGGAISGGLGIGGGGSWESAAIRGAAGDALTQGIGVATGLQDKFSWAGVAAGGVGGGVGFKVKSASYAARTAARTLADATTRTLIDGSDFGDNVLSALPSIALQEAIAGRAKPDRQILDPTSDIKVTPFEITQVGNVDTAIPYMADPAVVPPLKFAEGASMDPMYAAAFPGGGTVSSNAGWSFSSPDSALGEPGWRYFANHPEAISGAQTTSLVGGVALGGASIALPTFASISEAGEGVAIALGAPELLALGGVAAITFGVASYGALATHGGPLMIPGPLMDRMNRDALDPELAGSTILGTPAHQSGPTIYSTPLELQSGLTLSTPAMPVGPLTMTTPWLDSSLTGPLILSATKGASTISRPPGIPDNWVQRPTRSGGGTQYYNPANPNENVRYMPGNPNSPYPNSQVPYARQQNSAGTYLRADGSPSPLPRGGLHDPDAHIPISNFEPR